mgnify:CR=1 FL=1
MKIVCIVYQVIFTKSKPKISGWVESTDICFWKCLPLALEQNAQNKNDKQIKITCGIGFFEFIFRI